MFRTSNSRRRRWSSATHYSERSDHVPARSAAKHRETSGQMPKSPVWSGASTRSGQGRSGEATYTALAQRNQRRTAFELWPDIGRHCHPARLAQHWRLRFVAFVRTLPTRFLVLGVLGEFIIGRAFATRWLILLSQKVAAVAAENQIIEEIQILARGGPDESQTAGE